MKKLLDSAKSSVGQVLHPCKKCHTSARIKCNTSANYNEDSRRYFKETRRTITASKGHTRDGIPKIIEVKGALSQYFSITSKTKKALM